jgi:formyl-CoA transferase
MFWQRLCEVLGLEDVADLAAPQRLARKDELTARLAAVLLGRPRARWEAEFEAAGVPFGPVLALEDVVGSAQVAARGLVVEVPAGPDHPARRHVRQPLRFASMETSLLRHSPMLGEHTSEVLLAAGVAADDVALLIADGAQLSSRGHG